MKNPALLYEVSFFSALRIVFPESWKRSCPNFYAHDCTRFRTWQKENLRIHTLYVSWSKKKSFWYNAQGRRNRRGARDNFFHILEDCLNMIPSPWPSVKIQIVGAKIAKRDKTALTDLSTKLWFEMKSTKIYSKMLVLESPIFFLSTCILPDYVSHEIKK